MRAMHTPGSKTPRLFFCLPCFGKGPLGQLALRAARLHRPYGNAAVGAVLFASLCGFVHRTRKPTERAQPPLLPALAGSRGMWLFVFLSALLLRECASARFSLHARRLDRQTRAHAQARAGQTAHLARLVAPLHMQGADVGRVAMRAAPF